jgi:hypothetical protein
VGHCWSRDRLDRVRTVAWLVWPPRLQRSAGHIHRELHADDPARPGRGVKIIWYRHTERQQSPSKPRLSARLSLAAYPRLIEAPSVGSGGKEHLRLVAPEGLFIEEFYMAPPDESGDAIRTTDPEPAAAVHAGEYEPPTYSSRVAPERAISYTTGMQRLAGPCQATALLRPRLTGFLRTAQYTVLLTTGLLMIGAVAQSVDSRLSASGTSAEAAATVLLIIPSTMSAGAVRRA